MLLRPTFPPDKSLTNRPKLSPQLKDVNRKLEETRNAHAAGVEKAIADKRAAREALNHQQSQLVGALRRIQWLVERQKAELVRKEERRAYIQQLEKRLLNQHRWVPHQIPTPNALPSARLSP